MVRPGRNVYILEPRRDRPPISLLHHHHTSTPQLQRGSATHQHHPKPPQDDALEQ
ncbi:hypothetical protein B0H10DRAFT_2090817 [Mycena sp. CBHHK59/15]|nr:hypothetical protein B0H10DRAFT_2090817 [Mycena sp. CBHHK59/15]